MDEILKAKALLVGETRCAVVKGDMIYASDRRGIAPLLELYDRGEDWNGCVAADRIIGKAAALIYAKLGAAELFAAVLSRSAIDVLNRFDIRFSYGVLSDRIINRKGDGICPMEQTVMDIDDPDEAIKALKRTVAALRAAK